MIILLLNVQTKNLDINNLTFNKIFKSLSSLYFIVRYLKILEIKFIKITV